MGEGSTASGASKRSTVFIRELHFSCQQLAGVHIFYLPAQHRWASTDLYHFDSIIIIALGGIFSS